MLIGRAIRGARKKGQEDFDNNVHTFMSLALLSMVWSWDLYDEGIISDGQRGIIRTSSYK